MEIKYLTIRDWMLRLGLSHTEVVAFAIVWSFRRSGEGWFQGSAATVAKWMGKATKRPALNALASLVEKHLIEKRERWENGVRYCDYRALGGDALKALGVEPEEHQGGVEMTPGVVSKKHRGGVKTTSHNNNNNIDNGYKYPNYNVNARPRVGDGGGYRYFSSRTGRGDTDDAIVAADQMEREIEERMAARAASNDSANVTE